MQLDIHPITFHSLDPNGGKVHLRADGNSVAHCEVECEFSPRLFGLGLGLGLGVGLGVRIRVRVTIRVKNVLDWNQRGKNFAGRICGVTVYPNRQSLDRPESGVRNNTRLRIDSHTFNTKSKVHCADSAVLILKYSMKKTFTHRKIPLQLICA